MFVCLIENTRRHASYRWLPAKTVFSHLKTASKFKKYFDQHYYDTLRSCISPGLYQRKFTVDHFFVSKRWLFYLRANWVRAKRNNKLKTVLSILNMQCWLKISLLDLCTKSEFHGFLYTKLVFRLKKIMRIKRLWFCCSCRLIRVIKLRSAIPIICRNNMTRRLPLAGGWDHLK